MKLQKWVYLLTGLMSPNKVEYKDGELAFSQSREKISLERIGVRLKKVFLTEKERIRESNHRDSCNSRFIFFINDGIIDDNLAQRFADAVMSSLALVYDVAIEEIPRAIRISEDAIKHSEFVRLRDILGSSGVGSELYFTIMRSTGVPSEVLDYVWFVVPVVFKNQSLVDATHFYRESIMQAWVADDDVPELMYDNSDLPSSQGEKVRVETAYQNAFKAIEAVIGEPPKDERRLRMRLVEAGIDPDETVGYGFYERYGAKPGKEKLIKKLIDMHHSRDKKAAHGRTGVPRTIGYCELKDKQALAQHILLRHIDSINRGLIEQS
jgi:hypothetical protein